MAIVQELSEREGRAPHLIFHYLSSKVFLSSSLWAFQKANIWEEIVKVPADTLVRFLANTKNRFIQCMDNGERHLPDVIFQTV